MSHGQTVNIKAIAVDWIAKNLYWIDEPSGTPAILMAHTDGRDRKTVVNATKNHLKQLSAPTDLILYPQYGLVWLTLL